jgi:hypothetical protein
VTACRQRLFIALPTRRPFRLDANIVSHGLSHLILVIGLPSHEAGKSMYGAKTNDLGFALASPSCTRSTSSALCRRPPASGLSKAQSGWTLLCSTKLFTFALVSLPAQKYLAGNAQCLFKRLLQPTISDLRSLGEYAKPSQPLSCFSSHYGSQPRCAVSSLARLAFAVNWPSSQNIAALRIYTIPASSSQCSGVFFCKLSSGTYQRPLCSVVTGPAPRPHPPAIRLPATVSPICTGSLPSDRLLLLLFLY